MDKILKVVGMMSGTSLDGVDAALLETDGEEFVRSGPALSEPYSESLRALLQRTLAEAALPAFDSGLIREAELALTDAHAVIVQRLLAGASLRPREVALIGFHGQTILHRPGERRTWQIGDGARLAAATGVAVVNDFRSADVAAGGQGAPFVPLYHAALVRSSVAIAPPVVIANIGGVANVTFVGDTTILAFDTGPGNAPIDDWAQRHTGRPVDENGALAAQGRVRPDILAKLLENEYFRLPPPKSLDRMDFGTNAVEGLSPADGAATLTAFTASALVRALEHFPQTPRRWIVCGGGRHNPVLMQHLAALVGSAAYPAERVGWRGDFIEAEAFAYLAARSLKGLPLSLPTTTGVPIPMTGGRLHRVAA